ncbi:MAG: hypothetical protein ABL971_14555 [Vicinamibacterales bacterium]
MSYDENDAMRDAEYESLIADFYGQFGPEIANEAVDGFQTARLQSFFVEHPALIGPATKQLAQAQGLLAAGFDDAALVFAASAVELTLKQALFRPVVFGLVNSAPAALVIAELSMGHTAIDRFKNLLLDVLSELLGSSLRTYVHAGSTKPLWEEIKSTQDSRNAIVHKGEARSAQDATDAVRVAAAVVETLYPAIVRSVGLHLHGVQVCTTKGCKA